MQSRHSQLPLLAENDVLDRALNAILADPRELAWDDDYTREDIVLADLREADRA